MGLAEHRWRHNQGSARGGKIRAETPRSGANRARNEACLRMASADQPPCSAVLISGNVGAKSEAQIGADGRNSGCLRDQKCAAMSQGSHEVHDGSDQRFAEAATLELRANGNPVQSAPALAVAVPLVPGGGSADIAPVRGDEEQAASRQGRQVVAQRLPESVTRDAFVVLYGLPDIEPGLAIPTAEKPQPKTIGQRVLGYTPQIGAAHPDTEILDVVCHNSTVTA